MNQGLYYLALPYHGTEEQKAFRTELSLTAAAEFLRQGIHVFAPIIYVNQIAKSMQFSTQDQRRGVIMPYLLDFLKVSKGMVLVTTEGWKDSWGVRQELKFCQTHQIPVYKISPEQIEGNIPDFPGIILNSIQIEELISA